jgi:uncharacterized membrane protein
MAFKLSLVIHIIGLIMLMAGIMLGLRAGRDEKVNPSFLKSIQFAYLLPGVVMVLATGFFQFFFHGPAYYMTQGWFHGKLTAGLLTVGLGLLVFSKLSKVQQSGLPIKRSTSAILHSISGLLLFASVALVILGR